MTTRNQLRTDATKKMSIPVIPIRKQRVTEDDDVQSGPCGPVLSWKWGYTIRIRQPPFINPSGLFGEILVRFPASLQFAMRKVDGKSRSLWRPPRDKAAAESLLKNLFQHMPFAETGVRGRTYRLEHRARCMLPKFRLCHITSAQAKHFMTSVLSDSELFVPRRESGSHPIHLSGEGAT